MAAEDGPHDLTVHADAATVDQAHLAKAAGVGGDQVVLDDRGDVAGREGVQIERVLDGNLDGLVFV